MEQDNSANESSRAPRRAFWGSTSNAGSTANDEPNSANAANDSKPTRPAPKVATQPESTPEPQATPDLQAPARKEEAAPSPATSAEPARPSRRNQSTARQLARSAATRRQQTEQVARRQDATDDDPRRPSAETRRKPARRRIAPRPRPAQEPARPTPASAEPNDTEALVAIEPKPLPMTTGIGPSPLMPNPEPNSADPEPKAVTPGPKPQREYGPEPKNAAPERVAPKGAPNEASAQPEPTEGQPQSAKPEPEPELIEAEPVEAMTTEAEADAEPMQEEALATTAEPQAVEEQPKRRFKLDLANRLPQVFSRGAKESAEEAPADEHPDPWGDARLEDVPPQEDDAPDLESASAYDDVDAEKPGRLAGFREGVGNAARSTKGFFVHHKIAILAVVGALAAIYVGGSLFFSMHFLPNTWLNGQNVSLMSTGSLTSRMRNANGSYTTHVQGDGMDFELSGSDIGLSYDADHYAKSAASHTNPWTWPVSIFFTRDLHVTDGIAYDQAKLEQVVGNAVATVNRNAQKPTNAAITYDSQQGAFVAVEEKLGTEVDQARVTQAIMDGIATVQPTVELGPDQLVQPSVTTEAPEFRAVVERANDIAGLNFVLCLEGDEIMTIDSALVSSWLVVDDDYSLTGDQQAITNWAKGNLSELIDTVGTTRVYTLPGDNDQITVSGGTYGWTIDGATLAQEVCRRIEAASPGDIDVPVTSSGYYYNPGGKDWADRYIDVDLTNQYVRMYDENSDLIWESDCVSGDEGQGFGTVTGVYAIESMQSPAVLVGADYNGDSKPDYETDVNYWMPFYGGYGLHDATWRGYFGGSAYLYDGSHGCVNLPYSAAQELYELAEVGTPVVVHW